MKKINIFCAFFLALTAAAYCGQQSKIELTDGSVIKGEIVSYANNVYTINTANFGEIKVEGTKVSKIESANYVSPGAPAGANLQGNNLSSSQVYAYGQKLMEDPQNAAVITGLASDPKFQEMAKDPQIMEALKAGDMQALMKNPKFMSVANSENVQETVKKLKQ